MMWEANRVFPPPVGIWASGAGGQRPVRRAMPLARIPDAAVADAERFVVRKDRSPCRPQNRGGADHGAWCIFSRSRAKVESPQRQHEGFACVTQMRAGQLPISTPRGLASADGMTGDDAAQLNELVESLVSHPLRFAAVILSDRPLMLPEFGDHARPLIVKACSATISVSSRASPI
jgi:hypothetical protein